MRSLFERAGHLIADHTGLVAIAVVALTILGFIGAARIEMASGISTLVNTDSEAYRRFEKLDQNFGSSQIVLLVSADSLDQLIQPTNLEAFDRVAAALEGDIRIVSIVNPVDGLRQALAAAGAELDVTNTTAVRGALIDPDTGGIRASFAPLFPGGTNAVFAVTVMSDLEQGEQMAVSDAVESAKRSAGFSGVDAIVTGFPAVSSAIEEAIMSSLRITLLVALVAMLIVLTVLFPVRSRFYWRWLPLGSVFIGTILAFGAMGWAGQSMSIGSLTVFPVIVGLGVDYAIQFHNRFDEEFQRAPSLRHALGRAMRQIGTATGLAVFAAVLGAVALTTSSTPIMQDFAFTLIFGVVAVWVGGFIVVPTVLYWRERRSGAARTAPVGAAIDTPADERRWTQRGLRGMGYWVVRHPYVVLPVALAIAVGGFVVDDQIGVKTNQEQFLSNDIPAVRGLLRLQEAQGGSMTVNLIVENSDVADPELVKWADGLRDRLPAALPGAGPRVTSYADAVRRANGGTVPDSAEAIRGVLDALPEANRKSLVTDSHKAANISLTFKDVPIDEVGRLIEDIEQETSDPPAGASVTASGFPLVMADMFEALTEGRLKITLLGIAIVLAGLWVVYRFDAFRAGFAAIPMVLIVGWASGLMWAMEIDFSPLTATIGALIVGVGAEFGILILERYYEELGRGLTTEDAMVEAVLRIGPAVVASGVTAMAGFAALLAATDFPILQDFGIVTAVNLGFSIVSAVVVVPAVVVLIHGPWRRWRGLESARTP